MTSILSLNEQIQSELSNHPRSGDGPTLQARREIPRAQFLGEKSWRAKLTPGPNRKAWPVNFTPPFASGALPQAQLATRDP
jgi:hypothetical protein